MYNGNIRFNFYIYVNNVMETGVRRAPNYSFSLLLIEFLDSVKPTNFIILTQNLLRWRFLNFIIIFLCMCKETKVFV